MKRSFLLTLLILSCLAAFAQINTTRRKFADTEPMILRYRALCQQAYAKGDSKLASTYYDSITNCITHSYVDNYIFETIDKKKFDVGKTHKPIFLTVSASWCEPCMAEIPALNKVVNEYSDKVDFLVLFWDTKKDLPRLAKRYNQKIFLIPSKTNTTDDMHTIDIAGFRNINGYPDVFLINENREIMGFKTGAAVPMSYTNEKGKKITVTSKDAFNMNYKRLKDEVKMLLSKHI
ncbi:MAG TPA: thioredoxin family protein [Mucilaginibacter sp.]|nr:thioredoxin family protein [Mucilaginibacter sp.]